MIFTNTTTFSIVLISLLFIVGGYFILRLFKAHKIKPVLYIVFIFVLLLGALLGPRGQMKSETGTTVASNIAFVVDVSKSMDALDFLEERVSRLQMTKMIIGEYLKLSPDNKYSLDAFSGEAVKILPFTDDTGIYETFLSGLSAANVGPAGTDIQKALYSSISHFTEEQQGGLIVLFTDGGDEVIGDISELQDILKEKSIRVLIVGIGSKKGSYIPVGRDFFGRTVYKTYQGKKVVTELNSDELQALADNIGDYIEISDESDIDTLYNTIENTAEKISFDTNIEKRQNLSLLFVGLAFVFWVLFLVHILISKYRKQ